MRVSIEPGGCMGCGMCARTAPEVFSFDGSEARVTEAVAAPHNFGPARRAAAECPVNAIHIDD